MPAATPNSAILAKLGLEAIPESVKRLTAMIAKRGANAEEFAKIAEQDPALCERLHRAANPRAKSKAEYRTTTAEDAIQRTGMSIALLLAMSDPLNRAVFNAFHTMLGIELALIDQKEIPSFMPEHVLGEVSFEGKTAGLVQLRLPKSAGVLIGQKLLGLSAEDLKDPAVANDVIGEMCNMIVGNFKSNLCDAGLECKLSPPKISRTSDYKLYVVQGGTSERIGFHAKEIEFVTDLSVNPWVEFWK
jgi:CheY-specific phosphatase CheX